MSENKLTEKDEKKLESVVGEFVDWALEHSRGEHQVNCKFLSPSSKTIPRPHCRHHEGEGDCSIYLGKAKECKFRHSLETSNG